MSKHNKYIVQIKLATIACLLVQSYSSLYAFGMGGMHGGGHRDGNQEQSEKKFKSSTTQQDNIEKELAHLEKMLGLDEVQKIKFDKFSAELKDNFYALNDSRFTYSQFVINGVFDEQIFLSLAQKKTRLLAEIQANFIEKLFSILNNSQKEQLKEISLSLLWQK